MITQLELKSILNYNPDTGVFTWIEPLSKRYKSGDKAGKIHTSGHVRISLKYNKYYMHRLAWLYVYGKFPLLQIDHINGIRSDNRICNLRECTQMQNSRNRIVSNSSTGLKGVTFCKKRNKWLAQITVNYVHINLGAYDCKHKAHAAYKNNSRILHGEFSLQNVCRD